MQPERSRQSYINRVHIPIAHALLPAKDEETYRRFFKIVLEVYPELRPIRFKSDYELSAMNAVKKVYPGILCEGDSFHFVYNVTKRLQQEKIDDDSEEIEEEGATRRKKKISLLSLYRKDLEVYDQVSIFQFSSYDVCERM